MYCTSAKLTSEFLRKTVVLNELLAHPLSTASSFIRWSLPVILPDEQAENNKQMAHGRKSKRCFFTLSIDRIAAKIRNTFIFFSLFELFTAIERLFSRAASLPVYLIENGRCYSLQAIL